MKRTLAGAAGAVLGLAGAVTGRASAQATSVVNSPHNLSASGPGAVRALTEDQVCIFCHTPHNTSPVRPLWNRAMPTEGYTIYTSRALDARPGQPTGMSKMCLSCHDGTIALGAVVSRNGPILMSGGVTTIPEGRGRIGTDLSDDHPISFRYDAALASHDLRLRSPNLLPPEVVLDPNSELQCTTCHDAHNNANGSFLVVRNDTSQLCVTCHQMGQTTVSGHQTCGSCHQPHSSPSGPYLLKRATVGETCVSCHNGTVAGAANIAPDLNKVSVHETLSVVDPPEPHQGHVNCADCHEPHTMGQGGTSPPGLHPNFGRIGGVSAGGSPVASASHEYEVCFKCHAEGSVVLPTVSRRLEQNNTRLEFSPSAVSYHPVEAPGRNSMVPSLRPGWTTASLVACSSCHNSDTGRSAGGSGPDGVHGSNQEPLLRARYETRDLTSESAQAYALCYTCHDRASILDDRSFPGHKKHIQEERTPCAACHDAHGIASTQGTTTGNSNLINFAAGIVFPSQSSGRLEFRDLGTFRGECTLRCHGRNHEAEGY
ncbi:MAG: cytochrome c3 family protein [Phycisphaerales bacterium]